MAHFSYTARDPAGLAQRGAVDAPSRRDALRVISARGLRPLEVLETNGHGNGHASADAHAATRTSGPSTWSRKERLPFLQALSRLVTGGLSAGEAIRLLALRLREPPLRSLAATLWEQLGQGRTLSQAMADIPAVFDGQTISLVAAGEATGSLREVLPRLIQHFTDQKEARQRLATALAYPVFVCCLAVGVILFFLFFLLPRLQTLLNSLGGHLPVSTQILVVLANFLLHAGPFIVLGLALGGVVWWRWRKTDAGRLATDAWLLRVPFAGTYAMRTTVLNFSHTVAILLENGITTAESLRMAERTVTNLALREKLHAAIDRVLEGESLSTALARAELFPLLVLDQLAVGEQTGSLAAGLRGVAQEYQAEVSRWLQTFTRTVSGSVLAVSFAFVAFLVFAIVSAVMQVSASFKF